MRNIVRKIKNLGLPNILTILRIVCAGYILSATLTNISIMKVRTIYIIAIITDKLDGTLARYLNKITKLGRILEPIADTFLLLSTVVFLVFKMALPTWILSLALYLIIILVFGELFVFFARKDWYIPDDEMLGKVMMAMFYMFGLAYLFELPHREWLVLPVVTLGTITFLGIGINLIKFYFISSPDFMEEVKDA